jgi:hypothetical protein
MGLVKSAVVSCILARLYRIWYSPGENVAAMSISKLVNRMLAVVVGLGFYGGNRKIQRRAAARVSLRASHPPGSSWLCPPGEVIGAHRRPFNLRQIPLPGW